MFQEKLSFFRYWFPYFAVFWTGPSYLQRLCAGGTAGALAISVFNPAEAQLLQRSVIPAVPHEAVAEVAKIGNL